MIVGWASATAELLVKVKITVGHSGCVVGDGCIHDAEVLAGYTCDSVSKVLEPFEWSCKELRVKHVADSDEGPILHHAAYLIKK